MFYSACYIASASAEFSLSIIIASASFMALIKHQVIMAVCSFSQIRIQACSYLLALRCPGLQNYLVLLTTLLHRHTYVLGSPHQALCFFWSDKSFAIG
jgi:hypothetical protein